MTEPLRLAVADLERAAELLLEHVRSVKGDTVELPYDMFWAIPAEELYDVYKAPDDLTIGQLSESWGNLAEILDDEQLALGYGLTWLADILRAIGHTTVR